MDIVATSSNFSYIYLHDALQNVILRGIMDNENRNAFKFGFTAGAENWNGRLAMIGFAAALIIELVSGQGVLHFWGLM
jgi:hypothetical protein